MKASGGCQCGAVRFHVDGEPGRASICHCRMCQKATGGFYAPLVSVKVADLTWTRGEPARFASSNKVSRGFCRDCGTPLTFEWSAEQIDLSIGAFDDPAPLKPVVQLASEHRLPWVDEIPDLPVRPLGETPQAQAWYAEVRSNQHPDHDTQVWPPKA